jgi:hypothetical protein
MPKEQAKQRDAAPVEQRQELAVPIEFARALKAIDEAIRHPADSSRPKVFETVNGRRTILK